MQTSTRRPPTRLVARRGCRSCAWGIALLAAVGPALAQTPAPAAVQATLANLSLEELSHIKVFTAAKRSEALADTPAAVFVVTGQDVRRSGVTTLPDALRYAPGLDVAMINSPQWAVSARGFNGQYANQLLVMVDGRSIYNPSFGGVFWGGQDLLFDDLDRIEVVRGPGGALWGANAVNGVINILTRSSEETLGTVVRAGGGAFTEATLAARHGFRLSSTAFGRVYGKFDKYGTTPLASGGVTPDDWNRAQGGFRVDLRPDEATTLTFQGDAHRAGQGFNYPFPSFAPPTFAAVERYDVTDAGANLLGRWSRRLSPTSTLSAQAYYDYYGQRGPVLHQRLHTLDLDLQHGFVWGGRQAITWGLGFRGIWDSILDTRIVSVPGRPRARDQLVSLFGQDEIALLPDRLSMTLGAKVERNDYSGWEFSPSVRLLWRLPRRQALWGAVSRALATPNHLSTGIAYNMQVLPPGALGARSPATLVRLRGRADRPESLLAYEAGYRIQPVERVSVDVAAFVNAYSHLYVMETGAFVPGTPPVLSFDWLSRADGHTKGLEVAVGWQPRSAWRLTGSYTWFDSDVTRASVGRGDGGASPVHKAGLRSAVDLGRRWEWDTGFRYVGELRSVAVPSYLEMDLRLAWKPAAPWELALVGQSLLHDSHFEYPRGLSALKSEAPRSIHGQLAWRF